MRNASWWLIASIAIALNLGGCPGGTTGGTDDPTPGVTPGGGGGGGGGSDAGGDTGGDTGGDDGGDPAGPPAGGDDDSDPTTLTNAQADAVDDVVFIVTQAQATFAALHPLTQPQFDVDTAPGGSMFIPVSGGCPAGTLASTGAFLGGVLQFGDGGCSTALTGGLLYQGPVEFQLDRPTAAAEVDFNPTGGTNAIKNLTIAGVTVDGGFTATLTNIAGGIQFIGSGDVSFTGVGAIDGTLGIQILDSGPLSLDGAVTATGQATYGLTVDNVQSDPVTFDTFAPAVGSVSFIFSGADLEITFSNATPDAGEVTVRIDGGSPIAHTVSGL
jgi:polyisoprenoid-binding protein YceI